jgi:hypothetical protein
MERDRTVGARDRLTALSPERDNGGICTARSGGRQFELGRQRCPGPIPSQSTTRAEPG